jgi:NitT/TauT family transport system substrate-binding protein
MIDSKTRRSFLARSMTGAAALALGRGTLAQPLAKVVFGTNWLAQAEHGGFYQAVAEGIYRKHGIDATVRMGGPQVNGLQLLLAGQMDLFMGYDFQTIKVLEQGLPIVTVAATFQKDPAVLIAHPGISRIEELKDRPIYISAASETTFWPWLKARYGFTDAQKRPYSFSVQPFLADKTSATQGYATSEPYSVEKAGVRPTIFLLADLGYPPYAETIVARRDYLEKNSDKIRRFVQATAEGWRSYLANPAPGNALIKRDNPQMEDALLAFGLAKMKEYGIVAGGDAAKFGIMSMTDERWKRSFDFMASAGLVKPAIDYRKAYTLDIVRQLRVLP